MINPIHFIPGEIRYHSQFGKIGIGKLINKPGICRNDFVECCVKVIHQIRTVLRDRQIIVGLANPGKGNHVRILLNGIIRIYRSICQIGLEITVTRIIAAISEDVQLIIPSLIPTLEQITHNGILIDADSMPLQPGKPLHGQRMVVMDIDIIIFRAHSIIGEQHFASTFRCLGDTRHDIDFPFVELIQNGCPIPIYINIAPVRIIGYALQIIVSQP